jgi:iron complex outermembrane recepter protein
MRVAEQTPRGPQPRRVALAIQDLALLTSWILAAAARADGNPADPAMLDEVIVSAQKRSENLQVVPISIQALDGHRLDDLQITSFDNYAKYLTSLSVQSFGPGQAQLYVRGVTNGTDGLHVGSAPLVGIYVDEMPVTTIANNLDVHIYDVARVEALSGPQGTLFGASAMAGALRIITNKPSATVLQGSYDVTINRFLGAGGGGKLEGFVNVPLSERAAIRLVAYAQRDGGYINNVPGPPQTFPTSGIARTNAGLTARHFNEVETSGGRAALQFDINDRWTLRPTFLAQRQDSRGIFEYSPELGDLNVARHFPEDNLDSWWLAALSVEGKISDLELSYSAGYLSRAIDNTFDYSDYSYAYDVAYGAEYGNNFRDNSGNLISPASYAVTRDRYAKQSQEIRLATPKVSRLHGVAGVFLQRQTDAWRSEHRVDGLADQYSITNLPGVLYLNSLNKTDRDRAVFTDWTYQFSETLTVTAGVRRFTYDNSVYGFYGFNGRPTYDGPPNSSGEQMCIPGTQTSGTMWPCVNVDSRATGSGNTGRLSVTYRYDHDRMLYATWSTGFRPGGINRVPTRPPFSPDYLTNIELGWKTEWLGPHLRFNGALFVERWKDAQFSLFGDYGITEITNAGRSEIRGVESELTWRTIERLTVTAAVTALVARTTTNVCTYPSPALTCAEPYVVRDQNGSLVSLPNSIQAPANARLPESPNFKGNVVLHYAFTIADFGAHLQVAAVAQSDVVPAIQSAAEQQIGRLPGYASVDLAAGLARGRWQVELFVQNAFDRRGEFNRSAVCEPTGCPLHFVGPIPPRLVGLTFGQKL